MNILTTQKKKYQLSFIVYQHSNIPDCGSTTKNKQICNNKQTSYSHYFFFR